MYMNVWCMFVKEQITVWYGDRTHKNRNARALFCYSVYYYSRCILGYIVIVPLKQLSKQLAD